MSFCKSIRHCTRTQVGVPRQPALVVHGLQIRTVATFKLAQSPRIPGRSFLLPVPGASTRSYWWSSKSTAAASESSPSTETLQNETISTPSALPNEVKLDDFTSGLATNEQAVSNSESVAVSAPDLPSDVLPPPALQLGDLKELGFCHFTPVGAVQAALEFVQVTTGLPWWGTITLTTILARVAILHFTLKSTRVTARMAPFRPQLDALMKEVKEAKIAGDHLRMQLAVLKVKEIQKSNGFGVASSMAGPLVQGVVTISMFLGIKRLCDYPLAQLKFESVGWLNSLTAPDPYYILPALSLAFMNLQIHLGKADMAAGGKHMLHFANGFRVLGVVFLPFVASLPAGLLIHLVLNIGIVALQTTTLRNPAIRRALNIPPLPTLATSEYPSMRDTWNALLQWFRSQKVDATQKARERANIPAFPSANTSPTPPRRRRKV